MSVDGVGAREIGDVQQALSGFDSDIAGVTKFDDIPVGTDAVVEAQDYKNMETDLNTADYARGGPEKQTDRQIVAQQFDGSGSIVNRYV